MHCDTKRFVHNCYYAHNCTNIFMNGAQMSLKLQIPVVLFLFFSLAHTQNIHKHAVLELTSPKTCHVSHYSHHFLQLFTTESPQDVIRRWMISSNIQTFTVKVSKYDFESQFVAASVLEGEKNEGEVLRSCTLSHHVSQFICSFSWAT